MTKPKRPWGTALDLLKERVADLEELASAERRRGDILEKRLAEARQEIAILQAKASRSVMDYQQVQARQNGAGR